MPGSAASPPHFRPFPIFTNTSQVWPESERLPSSRATSTNTRAGLPQQHGMIGYCLLPKLLTGKGNESRARDPKSLGFVFARLWVVPNQQS